MLKATVRIIVITHAEVNELAHEQSHEDGDPDVADGVDHDFRSPV